MQFNTYTVAGAHVAVWLVNHPVPGARDLTAALRSHDVHEPAATDANALALRPWAIRLRAVFEAGTVNVPWMTGLTLPIMPQAPRPAAGGGGGWPR